MPKKAMIQEPEIIENEPEEEEEAEEIETPVKISKRTGKPIRPLTDKQKETLRKGREIAVAKKKALIEGVDLQKRAETLKKAKEELKKARDQKHTDKINNQKKQYEDALKEFSEDEETKEIIKPKKKIKKKVIKYVSDTDSSSSEEEVIIKKKKSSKKKQQDDAITQITKNELRYKLQEERQNSLASLLMPTYF